MIAQGPSLMEIHPDTCLHGHHSQGQGMRQISPWLLKRPPEVTHADHMTTGQVMWLQFSGGGDMQTHHVPESRALEMLGEPSPYIRCVPPSLCLPAARPLSKMQI